MAGRFLSLFKPISRITPEVSPPQRKVGFNEKIFWTAIALILYLIMTEVPIYGVPTQQGDPFLYLRVIFASHRGSLMELGIGPIVTAGLILQLLAGSVMLLDEMIQKGWGLGSGISLFILAGVAQSILWESLSVLPALSGGEALRAFGAVPSLIQALLEGQ